jgi:hypothetical protein
MMDKPGYKTTEFWLSMAAIIVGALLASGVLPADSVWLKVAGIVSSVLGAIGYTANRTVVKYSTLKADALKEAAKNGGPKI